MQTPQRFLSNLHSVVKDGTITADSVRPSSAIRPLTPTRSGNGRVKLTGPYTGAEAARVEIDIVNNAGSTARVSTPIFTGVGNGTLEDLSVDAGNPSQEYTAQLVDLGVDTVAATLEFFGVTLQAKTAGADGNDIYLSVDRSGITISSDPVAYLDDDISPEAQQWIGPAWDWGGLALDRDGRIPADSPRIVIGANYPVYRAYKFYEDGDWQQAISPKPVTDIAAGAPIYSVTGSYAVTVTDGTTTENYTSIVTLFDLLNAIRNQSALLEVVGAVVDDRTPGGMGSRELPLQTAAYTWPVTVEGSEYLTHVDVASVTADAESQTLTLECIDNSTTGLEQWSVTSSRDGELSTTAETGVSYADPDTPAVFTIPRKLPPAGLPVVSGTIAITERIFEPRSGDSGLPDICLYRPRLGGQATPKTLRLRWTKRPAEECSCEDETVEGAPSAACLGIELEEDNNLALDEQYQTRLENWYAWRSGMYDDEVNIRATSDSARSLSLADPDMQLVDAVTAVFMATLKQIYEDEDARDEWDDQATAFQAEIELLRGKSGSGASYGEWESETLLGGASFILPTTRNGHYYANVGVDGSGNTGSTEPTWPTDGGTVVDGDITWEDMGAYWSASTAVSLDVIAQPGNGEIYKCTTAGTTDSSEPYWSPVDDTITDGTVVWTRVTAGFGSLTTTAQVDSMTRRARAAMDYVQTIAGIVPKSEAGTGLTSSPCWTDPGDPYYWQIVGTDYLPVFNNLYYHSAHIVTDDDGNQHVESTQEFGFALRVGCPERLLEGDEVIIAVDDVVTRKTYQVGDTIKLPIIAADDTYLTGGVDGDDTHTWRISGSVDGFIGNYEVVHESESAFSTGGVELTIYRGGIPFELGDRWTWTGERGQFRWKYEGGSYSSNTDIPASGTIALADGLKAEFIAGKAPSFEVNDNYQFDVLQPYAPSNAAAVSDYAFQADDDANWTLSVDLGSAQAIGAVALALHDLPSTVTLELGLGSSAAATDETFSIAWNEGPIVKLLDQSYTYRYLRISATGATSARIGWLWAGVPAYPSRAPSGMFIEDTPAYISGGGFNPAGTLAGVGYLVELSYDLRLRHDDIALFRAMFSYAKANSNEPIILVPNSNYPDESMLLRWPEQIRQTDRFRYDPSDRDKRLQSLDLRLEPYYQ